MKHVIPDAVLAQHLAILGKTGSGKTSTEKVIIEQVVDGGFRVCVLDTTKSDHWGLTSSADGKRAGLPFKILGGPRGHVPLHSSAGKAIGQLVGTGKLPLSIIDMADFEPGGLQRFFVDFAPALMRSMTGVLYLVIEEAHELAPKERAGFGAENMAIHWAKKLATAGRSKGIRLIVATQRVQSLHNAVLGSCETVIAHRLTTPADQKPILDWLKANAERGIIEMVSGQLSSLKTGAAWVCSGEAKIFERMEFPTFPTYDNAATPTKDGTSIDVKTAPVNPDELRAIIGDAVKEAEANDPAKLKAEIAKLKSEIAKRPAAALDERATEHAFNSGHHFGVKAAFEALRPIIKSHGRGIGRLREAIEQLSGMTLNEHVLIDGFESEFDKLKSGPSAASTPARTPTTRPPAEPSSRARVLLSPEAGGDSNVLWGAAKHGKGFTGLDLAKDIAGDPSLTKAMRETLGALMWWASIVGIDTPTRKQLAAMIGITPTGSTMRSRLAALTGPGLVEYPTSETLRLTDAGRAAAPAPNAQATLIETVRASLTGTERETFDAIPPAGKAISRADLGAALGGIEPGGSTLRSRLANLSNRELIHYPSGMVARQDWVV
jgi:hypothetical protein